MIKLKEADVKGEFAKIIAILLSICTAIMTIYYLTGCTSKSVHKTHKTLTVRDNRNNRDNKVRNLDQVMGSEDNVKSTNEELIEVK
jgi:hypothetical protein